MITKRVETFAGLKKGQKFRVTQNTNGHNYPLDTILTLKRNGPDATAMNDCAEGRVYNTLNATDLEVFSDTKSITDMEAEITELNNQITGLRRKIAICKDFGIEAHDDELLKVFEALRIASKEKTTKQKALVLKEILFGGNGV